MAHEILNGPTMAVVGIGTVFVALAILVAIVSMIARLLTPTETARAVPVTVDLELDAAADAVGESRRRRQVALAAYAFHLARRVSVRSQVASSPWLRAGRQAQVNRIRSRG